MESRPFLHLTSPSRVSFGEGVLASLPREIAQLGCSRALVITSKGQRPLGERVARLLGEKALGHFDGATVHVPVALAREAAGLAKSLNADCCIAIGGGSTIGLAKAIALELPVPIVAIPTTFSGSEMTPVFGLTESGLKRTGRDPRVLPRAVLYDPELLASLPAKVAGPSAINALAHCVEALYAPDRSPIWSLLAAEGARALAQSLPKLMRESQRSAAPDPKRPRELEAIGEALYGAWLAGSCLGAVSMSLHHKLCHALGGAFNLPHAELHSVLLPYSTDYNRLAAPEAMQALEAALGVKSAPAGIFDLARVAGAPSSLRELGLRESDLPRAMEVATQNPYSNPRPVEPAGITLLLQCAFKGERPA